MCCAGLTPDGQTLGTPIAVLVRNKDQRSGDYSEMSVRGACTARQGGRAAAAASSFDAS
jgi:chorismate synthase